MVRGLKIAFIGSRGIPARYGGAETFVEEISQKLIRLGAEVYVTCESHRFKKDGYNGVFRIHSPSIQGKTITVPTVNDLLSTLHLMLRCPGIQLVYYVASDAALAAIIPRLLGKRVIVHMDGIEWRRPLARRAYLSPVWKLLSPLISWYLRLIERLAVWVSHAVIADSEEIKAYLQKVYKAKNIVYISHGARELLNSPVSAEKEREILQSFGLSKGEYYLTVGRIVAENNIHVELNGFKRALSNKKMVIVGNFNERDKYTTHLMKLRDDDPKIIFLEPIYDKEVLGVVRKNCYAYIHAYQVGGTNPSLLEQMLFGKAIMANDNPFHREVLQDGGIYFKDEDSLAKCINMLEGGEIDSEDLAGEQIGRVEEEYNWDSVIEKYKALFSEWLPTPS